MKRFAVLCLTVVMIWSFVSGAFASGVNLLTVMGARISSGISSNAQTVTGCVRHRNCAAKPAKLSTDSAEIEQQFRAN